MRIRKHAKISPLHYASSVFLQQHGAILQPYVCQLNQSPWDVITFPVEGNDNNQQSLLPPPPPPAPTPSSSYKLDGYDSCAVNGAFYDSEQSITSMKLLNDNREIKKMKFFDNNVTDVPADFVKDEEMVDGDNNVTTMCCKNDGKGWQCSREAKRGHNLCEHHFAQVKKHYSNNNNSAQYSTAAAAAAAAAANSDTEIKQTSTAAAETMTPSSRGRPHRPKKLSSSDFYYYSGFGPLWGKKRGALTGKKNYAAAAEIYCSHDSTTYGAQPLFSQIDNEGFEYVEDEDDDEVENCKLTKRARKPIKARSLKSLM